jgi:hypothetical protein
MWSYVLLVTVAPLVLAAPAPVPHPVAAPAPVPVPIPQGTETTPLVGLLGGLIQGTLSLGSLQSAIPAVISDAANFADSAAVVARMLNTLLSIIQQS